MQPEVRDPCRVCAEPVRHDRATWCSGICRQTEKDAWWALVKAPPGIGRAKRWAAAYIGRDDEPETYTRNKPTGHTCGWAADADGVWQCVQDHYAVGFRPDTGCGATWLGQGGMSVQAAA